MAYLTEPNQQNCKRETNFCIISKSQNATVIYLFFYFIKVLFMTFVNI